VNLRGLRVLWCHNRYRITGGEDVSAQAEAELLTEVGVEIDRYEVSNDMIPDRPGIGYGLRTVWSQIAYREVLTRLRQGRHHLIHVQNFFPLLSPAILWAARRAGVPVVLTLRNFRLTCLNGLLFREGRICEDCMGRSPFPGVLHRCYRGSMGASAATAGMLVVHRLLGTWQRTVDVFVAPSAFAKAKLASAGLDATRIVVKPNFVHPDPGPGSGDGGFILYAGRMSPEKGIGTLLAAWRRVGKGPRLLLVGAGPLAEEVRRATAGCDGIEYVGAREPRQVLSLMASAALVVVPSEWYETFGRVVVEAFAVGTPVVASAVGPLAEMVEPGETGALVPPGDPEALAGVVRELWSQPAVLGSMRLAARRTYEERYTAERNLEVFLDIYRRALRAGHG
jgi:glycosyltransferase involved in cell wall biosynthesis